MYVCLPLLASTNLFPRRCRPKVLDVKSYKYHSHCSGRCFYLFWTVFEFNGKGSIPYVPWLQAPYYMWIGRKRNVKSEQPLTS